MSIYTTLSRRRSKGFSLVEMMVSVALLAVLLLVIMQMLDSTQKTWKASRASVSEFKDARVAFEAITRRLSQATLNAYWGYQRDPSTKQPKDYVRQSELHFVSGPCKTLIGETPAGGPGARRTGHAMFFQAPAGYSLEEKDGNLKFGVLQNLLNGVGYWCEFCTDDLERPPFLKDLENKPKPRPRYRLIEFRQAAENLRVYELELSKYTPQTATITQQRIFSWFAGQGSATPFTANWSVNYPAPGSGSAALTDVPTNRIVAENILALILTPCETLDDPNQKIRIAPDYLYDSQAYRQVARATGLAQENRNQLPPLMDLTMIALDEGDFNRYCRRNSITDASKDPGLFRGQGRPNLFEKASEFDRDLDDLKKYLSDESSDHYIQYRIFRATVRMREAKWSQSYPLSS